MTRYSFTPLGNCIDIHDAETGHTVAFVNCMDRTPEKAFADWLAIYGKTYEPPSVWGIVGLAVALFLGFAALALAVAAIG